MNNTHNLSPQVKTVVLSTGVAAGNTPANIASVDMQGYQGVRFIAVLGALAATQVTSLKAQQSDDNAVADDFSDIAGTKTNNAADGDAGKTLILELYRPEKRYVRPVINRATANAAITCVIAELFNASQTPVAADATVSAQKLVVSPIEGTA